jgi:hypothetical protein
MEGYEFKLIQSYAPTMDGRIVVEDSNVGGIKNTYRISFIKYICIGKFTIIFSRKVLGVKGFLKPYKKVWNKYTNRLKKPYWGKKNSPFTNLWIVLTSDYKTLGNRFINSETTTQSFKVKVLGISFRSTTLGKNLNKCSNFIINQKN